MGAGASHTSPADISRRNERNHPSSNDSDSVESTDPTPPRDRYHWCHQCEQRVGITPDQGQCLRCGGGFVEQLSAGPPSSDILVGSRLVSSIAAHLTHSMGLDPDQSALSMTEPRAGGRANNVSSELRMEELLRDLQAHLRMAEDIRSAMRAAMAAERPPLRVLDPAGPSVWQSIKKLNKEEISKFVSTSDDQCVICCADYTEEEEPQQLCELPGCKHVFHEDCLQQWLSRASNCPICRSDLKAALRESEAEEKESTVQSTTS